MIKNERQYAVTRDEICRFEQALREMQGRGAEGTSARLRKAREDALGSQVDDLRAEVAEYEALRAGRAPRPPASFSDVARFLIQTRISRGWTHQEFARHCGLKEQQIQRYEANDYQQASLARICELAAALGVDLPAAEDAAAQ